MGRIRNYEYLILEVTNAHDVFVLQLRNNNSYHVHCADHLVRGNEYLNDERYILNYLYTYNEIILRIFTKIVMRAPILYILFFTSPKNRKSIQKIKKKSKFSIGL